MKKEDNNTAAAGKAEMPAVTCRLDGQHLRRLLEFSNDGIVIADVDGRVVEWNPAAERIFGIPHSEARGRRLNEIQFQVTLPERRTPENYLRLEKMLNDFLRTGQASWADKVWEQHIELPDGSRRWLQTVAFALPSERGFMAASINRDVTERKQAEEQLRQAKDDWEQTFDAVPDLICVLDVDQRIRRLNRALAEHLGRPPEQCVGLPCYRCIHDMDEPPDFCPHRRLVEFGVGQTEEVYEPRLGGYLLVSVVPLRDAQGRLIGSVHVARDITKRKAAEDALRQAHNELERRVQERTAALAQANAALAAEVGERRRVETEVRRLNEELEQRVSQRTRSLTILYDVTSIANACRDMETMLDHALACILQELALPAGTVHLLDEERGCLCLVGKRGLTAEMAARLAVFGLGEGHIGCVAQDDERRMAAVSVAEEFKFCAGVPMRVRGQVRGVLTVYAAAAEELRPEIEELLGAVADQLAVAVDNAHLHQQAEELAIVEERRRLARELHDSVTQALYSLTLFAGAGRRALELGDMSRLRSKLEDVEAVAHQALKEMRLLLYELRPLALEQMGLVDALRFRLAAVEQRVGVEARLQVEGVETLPLSLEKDLYHIAVEALNNALKHARATWIMVRLSRQADRLTLEIADNGQGFDPALIGAEGMGLRSMCERADRLGGRLEIDSPALGTGDQGTRVRLELDLARARDLLEESV